MAISKKTKNKYNQYSADYSNSNSVNNAKKKLAEMATTAPELANTYDNQLKKMYNNIKKGKEFSYIPENDAAYRRFADEYNALAGLAIAGNQQQAQELTGGYGSTYAPEVSNQGLITMKENAEYAKPLFMEQAQKAYMENTDADMDAFEAGINAKNDEINEYAKQAEAYNNQYQMNQKRYSERRDFDYTKYKNNRDYWAKQYLQEQQQENYDKEFVFKKYDTYNKLAANKCADYNKAHNNKGMRAYLNKLVKEDKLTKYMADLLYKQYKYTAPVRISGGGGYRRSGNTDSDPYADLKNWTPDNNVLRYVNERNRGESYETALHWVQALVNRGDLTKEEQQYYKLYYRKKFEK